MHVLITVIRITANQHLADEEKTQFQLAGHQQHFLPNKWVCRIMCNIFYIQRIENHCHLLKIVVHGSCRKLSIQFNYLHRFSHFAYYAALCMYIDEHERYVENTFCAKNNSRKDKWKINIYNNNTTATTTNSKSTNKLIFL